MFLKLRSKRNLVEGDVDFSTLPDDELLRLFVEEAIEAAMFNAMTNPNGAVSENFLRDSSRFNIDVEFGLPLYGKVANFAVQDTFDFTVDNIDQVQQLLIRSDIINEFPMDAKMQIFFTDDSYHESI